jgi:hypothetical protein
VTLLVSARREAERERHSADEPNVHLLPPSPLGGAFASCKPARGRGSLARSFRGSLHAPPPSRAKHEHLHVLAAHRPKRDVMRRATTARSQRERARAGTRLAETGLSE